METIWKTYPPTPFTVLGRIEPSLRLAQIRLAILTFDGGRVGLKVTDSKERVAEKRALGILDVPAGCHAIDLYDRRGADEATCEIVVGTEGIDTNSALEHMLAGLGTILDRDGRTNLVCASTSDTHCYARVKNQGVPAPWVDLTEEFDAAEIAYVPGAKVYIARKHDSNRLGVLPIETALEGNFSVRHWRFVRVPGARLVTAIQPRIHTSRAVMIHLVNEEGNPATIAYNFEMVGVGQIEVEADALARTSPALRFRGFLNGDVALVQSTAPFDTGGLPPGISLVPTSALPGIFGDAARKLIAACMTA